MQQLSAHGQQFIQDLAQRYGVSTDAAITMLYAVMNGNGTMAQFSHPELGGSGQWMMGGMTMVGDMFNYGLKSKVDGLCVEISNQIQSSGNTSGGNLFVSAAAAGQWWPGDLGSPSSTGGQNNVRYAVFPGSRRLVVDIGGQVTVYDTLDNQIGGVSQQQGGNDSMTFSSQYGTITVNSLPVISINGYQPQQQPQQNFMAPPVRQFNEPPAYQAPSAQEGDVFAKIERLADLFKKGILTEQEFSNKKMELLNQL